jgi:hypothetical protein
MNTLRRRKSSLEKNGRRDKKRVENQQNHELHLKINIFKGFTNKILK